MDASISLDDAERTVEAPDDLARALEAQPGLRAAFDALSASRRKEAARGVAEAKQPATRERRIAEVIEDLRAAGT